ncbi:hypothetical protein ABTC40_18550, partial [Acinetobacter baumannii]
LRQLRNLAYPGQKSGMFRRGLVETRDGQAHQAAPFLFTHAFFAGQPAKVGPFGPSVIWTKTKRHKLGRLKGDGFRP